MGFLRPAGFSPTFQSFSMGWNSSELLCEREHVVWCMSVWSYMTPGTGLQHAHPKQDEPSLENSTLEDGSVKFNN